LPQNISNGLQYVTDVWVFGVVQPNISLNNKRLCDFTVMLVAREKLLTFWARTLLVGHQNVRLITIFFLTNRMRDVSCCTAKEYCECNIVNVIL